MVLTPRQYEAAKYLADDVSEEILFGGGAGGGKSAFGAIWLIDRCTRLPGSRWLMGRAKLKTLKDTTLKSFLEVANSFGLKSGNHYTFNGQSNIIKFNNGSEILLKDLFLYPSDPNFDELGSLEITGAFVDECNQITVKARNVLKSRIRYRLDDFGVIPKMLMTCNPAKNYVYTDYYKPSRDGTLPQNRKFVKSLVTDNPHISKYYEQNLNSLDEASKRRLLYGDWEYDDSPDKLINFNNIVNLFDNSFVEEGEPFITADIARMGSDKAVIMAWLGLKVVEVVSFDISRLNVIQEAITAMKMRYKVPNSNIIADEDGVGGGVIDFMNIRGFINNSSPLKKENYQNLKSQCYYKLAELVNANKIYIADDSNKESIIEELEWVKSYKNDMDGKLRVLPKEKVKEGLGRSPDFSDALMFRMYFEIVPNVQVYRKVY